MEIWLAEIIAVCAFLGGSLYGNVRGRKFMRKQLRNQPREPICGCTHHLAFHDKDGCHKKQVLTRGIDDETYVVEGSEVIECGCVRYVGPEPVPDYIEQQLGMAAEGQGS